MAQRKAPPHTPGTVLVGKTGDNSTEKPLKRSEQLKPSLSHALGFLTLLMETLGQWI